MEEIGYLMVQIFLLLFLAESLGMLLKKAKIPEMVGYILAGIIFINLTIFVPSFSSLIHFDIAEVEGESDHFLNVMGQVGLVFLMFGIGLETRLSELLDIGRTALIVALFSIAVPFLGGFLVYFLFGSDSNTAVMVGTALFASSTTITVNLLSYYQLTDTQEGKTVIGISIVVDILCLILLAVVTNLVSPVHGHAWWMNILIILVFIVAVFAAMAHLRHKAAHRSDLLDRFCSAVPRPGSEWFVLACLVCFGLTACSYLVGLSGIVGAFLAGMFFAEYEAASRIREQFDTLTRFLLPFFFIYVGLRLHFDVMGLNALLMAAVLVVVALATKYVGAYAGCRVCRMEKSQANFTAICTLARGDIAIIVATLAHEIGLFSTNLYAAVIIMAVFTQILVPIIMRRAGIPGQASP
ncbi:MAG: cation:proton antiporter [Candidatus Methanomethylophilus sp.]|nr:cation:proton antiporter [Methanomethylophilus sp.]MDD3233321.1 cation:proton antiporter [Methanomethylophilus sp.]MDD4221975.1 cation:proton antiporter [Methanomethylophilus sp.]MDD4668320.1 cation:proton antiporter [Methanomethylophilus sp.]